MPRASEKGEVAGSSPARRGRKVQPATRPAVAQLVRVPTPSVEPEVVAGADPARSRFDRIAYQRQYMADRRKAKAVGLTVTEWRAKMDEALK